MVNMEMRLMTFFAAEDGEVLYSQQKLDRELTVAQIPYNYAVEMTNRFKGLGLIDRVPKELWREVHGIVQEVVIKTIPKKKK